MAQLEPIGTITQFKLSNQILDIDLFSKIKLTASAKLVLIVLCRYYPKIYPCQKTIAKKAGLSLRSVINAISELKQKGLLLVECNYSNTYKFTNLFFELAEVSHSTGKTCIKHNEKFAHNKTNKNNNKQVFQKNHFKDYQKPIEGIKYKSASQTIQQIEKDRQMACTPLDFNKEQAIEFINKLPEFAKSGFYAIELRKKWKL